MFCTEARLKLLVSAIHGTTMSILERFKDSKTKTHWPERNDPSHFAISICAHAPEHRNCDLIFEAMRLQCDVCLLWLCYVDVPNYLLGALGYLSERANSLCYVGVNNHLLGALDYLSDRANSPDKLASGWDMPIE